MATTAVWSVLMLVVLTLGTVVVIGWTGMLHTLGLLR